MVSPLDFTSTLVDPEKQKTGGSSTEFGRAVPFGGCVSTGTLLGAPCAVGAFVVGASCIGKNETSVGAGVGEGIAGETAGGYGVGAAMGGETLVTFPLFQLKSVDSAITSIDMQQSRWPRTFAEYTIEGGLTF